jgi:hypothetical protein
MNHSGPRQRGATPSAFVLAACLLALPPMAQGRQTGITRSNADLRAAPYNDAHLIITLVKDTQLHIFSRRGPWLKVNVDAYGDGWVKLHLVRIGDDAARERSSFSGIAALWRSWTGRGGSSGLVATTGIRGLEDQDLRNAKPDPQAVAALDAYKVSEEQARVRAEQTGLVVQQVKYDPKKYKKKKKKKRKKRNK